MPSTIYATIGILITLWTIATAQNERQLINFHTSVGTPIIPIELDPGGVKMNLLLDTGSFITWVRSDRCKSGPDCTGSHAKFTPTIFGYMAGALVRPSMDTNTYGGGDTMTCHTTLADITVGETRMNNRYICAASTIKFQLRRPIDGIIGIGISKTPEPTNIIKNILNQYYPGHKYVSIYFDRSKKYIEPGEGGSTSQPPLTLDVGEISIGRPNPERHTGPITYIGPVKGHTGWTVPFLGITLDGTFYENEAAQYALVDTGTDAIQLPFDLFMDISEVIGDIIKSEPGNLELECSKVRELKTMTFKLGTLELEFTPPMQFVVQNNKCLLVMTASQDNEIVLGSFFARNFYTSYDFGNSRVGFGVLADQLAFPKLPSSA